MSNEEVKKRWVVRSWAGGSGERQAFENVLNELDAEGYEIFDVDHRKSLVTGRLTERDELDSNMPSPIGALTEAIMNRFRASRDTGVPDLPSAPAQVEMDENEGEKAMREYMPQGVRTMHLLSGIEAVTSYAQMGDPQTEQRLSAIISQLFSHLPIEETRKSLVDIEFFKEHHSKYNCQDPHCQSHKVFDSVVNKLKARLAARPAN